MLIYNIVNLYEALYCFQSYIRRPLHNLKGDIRLCKGKEEGVEINQNAFLCTVRVSHLKTLKMKAAFIDNPCFKRLGTRILSAMLLLLLLSGCSTGASEQADKIRDLEFSVVAEDEQPKSLRDVISQKGDEAFEISFNDGEYLYIAVGYGVQTGAGYSITVNALYEGEESICIDTTLIGPDDADAVSSAPTRPYVVVKTENIENKPVDFK